MPLDPVYNNCRQGKHKPVDVETQENGAYTTLTARCSVCDAELSFDLSDDVWDANHTTTCSDCGEAPPYCECPS